MGGRGSVVIIVTVMCADTGGAFTVLYKQSGRQCDCTCLSYFIISTIYFKYIQLQNISIYTVMQLAI
jgi:hypothetical protein